MQMTLPRPSVVVVDPTIAGEIGRAIKQTEIGTKADVFYYTSAGEALRATERKRRTDLHVVVSDTVGTEPVGACYLTRLRVRYPNARVILYCDGVNDARIVKMQNSDRIIDRYIPKTESIANLVDTVIDLYNNYEMDPVLQSVRAYIRSCPNPSLKFMSVQGRDLDMFDVYFEIHTRTGIGMAMRTAWQELLLSGLPQHASGCRTRKMQQ